MGLRLAATFPAPTVRGLRLYPWTVGALFRTISKRAVTRPFASLQKTTRDSKADFSQGEPAFTICAKGLSVMFGT